MDWTTENIPSLEGKIAIVTGANSGLGLEITRVLALKGAEVILAVRNMEKGRRALERLIDLLPNAKLTTMHMDLGSIDSIKGFYSNFKDKYNRLDLLINNAGLGDADDSTKKTKDGFGWVMGINHMGHYVLTLLCLELLLLTPNSRVVTMTSGVYKNSNLNPDTFYFDNKGMYGPSKLANLLFALELQRRLSSLGTTVKSLAAHPGASRTEGVVQLLQKNNNPFFKLLFGFFVNKVMQSKEMGALGALRAATDHTAEGGQLYGPGGLLSIRGYPKVNRITGKAKSAKLAKLLWERTGDLTGYTIFPSNFEPL